MKGLRKLLFVAFTSVISVSTYASWETKVGKVSKVDLNSSEVSGRNVIVKLEGVTQMCDMESANDTAYFNRYEDPATEQVEFEMFDAFLSSIIAAKATGDRIRLLVTESPDGCKIGRVELLSN